MIILENVDKGINGHIIFPLIKLTSNTLEEQGKLSEQWKMP
jgi:hypothetical protein